MKPLQIEIIGAGIFGLSIAFVCLLRGARVRVIDKVFPGAGSSGGLLGSLSPHMPDPWNAKKQFQLESLLEAESFWERVGDCAGFDPGYRRAGRLMPIMTEGALAMTDRRIRAAERNWPDGFNWQVVNSHEIQSWKLHAPTGRIVYENLTASIAPRLAVACLVKAIRKLSGEIKVGTSRQGKADVTILATGYEGLIELERELGVPVGRGEKGQAITLECEAGDRPQVFAGGLHIVPQAGNLLAVGSTSERHFEHPTATDGQATRLQARAAQVLPELAGAALCESWANVRPRSVTRAPLIGPHPLYANIFIANGGFKIGFGLAPRVAECMASLVIDGKNLIPDEFTPAHLVSLHESSCRAGTNSRRTSSS